MNGTEYKPANPFAKKLNNRNNEDQGKKPTKVIRTFKQPFQDKIEDSRPSSGMTTKEIMNGKFAPQLIDDFDIPEFTGEEIKPMNGDRNGKGNHFKNSNHNNGHKKGNKALRRPSNNETPSPNFDDVSMPEYGKDLLKNPMARMGIDFTKK